MPIGLNPSHQRRYKMIRLIIGVRLSGKWHFSEFYFNGVELVKCGTENVLDIVYWIKPIEEEV
jgi:hypothetical protein